MLLYLKYTKIYLMRGGRELNKKRLEINGMICKLFDYLSLTRLLYLIAVALFIYAIASNNGYWDLIPGFSSFIIAFAGNKLQEYRQQFGPLRQNKLFYDE